ncbi:phosphonoacetaldehyde hydrolase [Alcaligenes faecalis subsp. faecalis]|uniref:phosphonoacetaldehyde hydrolase n=1 Tax=Alcaligenes faecalis TaxID=511 RepID=UPI001F01E242|nr:phosphonoacetaldehyde hydrolase [Alcaligenes faecalis]MBW4787553.1 phosphonoacetaldehyde hydrolase [Alcaligenes faecalis subsp. faecalis]
MTQNFNALNSLMSDKVEAVIFDWAGTLVDFSSLAPTQIFVDAFATFGIQISLEQARGPMGLSKRDHIRTLLATESIQDQWLAQFERASTDADIDAIYERFMPMQIEKVAEYSAPIEGAAAVLEELRAKGIKIGSCSGYPRQVLDVLLPAAANQGIAPDCIIAGDELPAGGRPGPFMALANVLALGVGDVRRCIKVDDTVPGIEEGRRAGMWTVGLSLSGNEVGLSLDELAQTNPAEVQARVERASERLRQSGAHYVIETVADFPAVVLAIQARLAQGETP